MEEDLSSRIPPELTGAKIMGGSDAAAKRLDSTDPAKPVRGF